MKKVDELLAAPDTVAKNKIELRKYHQRKEQEQAKKKRNRATKRKSRPSMEDMLADIIRVAEDENTNPFHEFRSISSRRYELYGYYPIEFIDQEFGQFNHALEVAGLRDQPGTRLWRANRANSSRREHAKRYVERYVAPYFLDPQSKNFNDDGSYTILSISDTHSQHMCPFTWLCYLQALRDLRPDCALLNGDTLEGTAVSRHPQIPGWTEPLQSELDFKREMFRQIREDVGFSGDLFDTGGNHDTADRLMMYVTQVAKGLASLDCLRVDELLGLDQFNVELFHGGTIMSPKGTEDAKSGMLLFDFYRIHHGTLCGKHPAASELGAAGRSGQSGHVHRAQLHYGTTERDEGQSWMCTPAGCREEAARAYLKGTTPGWQRGLGFARLFPNGTVHQYPCIVQRGGDGRERLTIEGITYTRPDDLLDPPTTGQWLQEYRLA